MQVRRIVMLVCAFSHAILFTPLSYAQAPVAFNSDKTPPEIQHDPITSRVAPGNAVIVAATAHDESGVKEVMLYYRSGGVGEYQAVLMKAAGDDKYEVSIPAEQVQQPNVEYYIEASDTAGNTVSRGGRFFPLTVSVVPTMGDAETVAAEDGATKPKETSMWLWVLGALAVGAIAAAAGGGGGGGGGNTDSGPVKPTPTTGSVSVVAPPAK